MPVNPEDAGSYFTDLFGLSRGEKRRNPTHSRERRYLHFKFEPMILHVLTASPHHAQLVLQSAMLSGFRESGAMTSTSYARSGQLPMVAVRCQGLGLDSIIGYLDDGAEEPTDLCSMVDEDYLRTIVAVVNERFVENSKRTERFRQVLLGLCKHDATYKSGSEGWANAPWEDPEMRRARKRAQGLSQQRAAQTKKEPREGPDERQAESVEPLDQEDEVDILSGVGFNASP
ncbi:MAG: hypothetical protein M1832_002732 [Thelocarpon impressellum]|nr:MAG: hypothetical protein M1832_002732 [Thelocarpon impressellum]